VLGPKSHLELTKTFALIKFALNELHSIEIIVDRSWDLNLLRANEEFALSMFRLEKFDCANMFCPGMKPQ